MTELLIHYPLYGPLLLSSVVVGISRCSKAKEMRCTPYKAEDWIPVAAKHLYWFINEIAIIIRLAFAKYDVCRLDGWLFYIFTALKFLTNLRRKRIANTVVLNFILNVSSYQEDIFSNTMRRKIFLQDYKWYKGAKLECKWWGYKEKSEN